MCVRPRERGVADTTKGCPIFGAFASPSRMTLDLEVIRITKALRSPGSYTLEGPGRARSDLSALLSRGLAYEKNDCRVGTHRVHHTGFRRGRRGGPAHNRR